MKVETYNSNVSIDASPQQGMNPRAIGDGGMSALAQGLGHIAQAGHAMDMRQKQIMDRQNEEEAHLWALNTMSDLRQKMLTQFEEAKNGTPDGADGFAGQQNKLYEETLQNLLKEAPNPRAKVLFETKGREFQSTFFAHALGYESNEKQRAKLQSVVDGAKLESNEIDQAANPTQVYLGLVPSRLEFISNMREDPATRAKMRDGITSHYSRTLVLAEARRDPEGTLAKIDDGTFSKLPGWNLYGDQLETLRRGVETRINSLDRSKSSVIKDAITEWKSQLLRQEVDASGNIAVTKLPFSDAEVEKALGPVAYKHWKEEEAVLPVAQKYGTGMVRNSEVYAQTVIGKVREDIASGKLSATLGNQVEDYLVKQAQLISKQRQDDAAGAADETARKIFGDDYTNGNRADQLLLREAAQIATFGLPAHRVRLLTNSEVKTLATDLSGMSLDQAQNYMRSMAEQLQPSGRLMVNVIGKDGSNTDAKRLSTQIMEELFSYGKLDKGFMFMNFTADTKYGNYFAKAMRVKNDEELTTGLPQSLVREIKTKIDEHPELKNFSRVMRMSAGTEGAGYASVLETLVRRTAYMTAGDASGPDASSLVDSIVKNVISDQVTVNNTYYVPKQDHLTGRTLDADKVDAQLKKIGDAWLGSNGQRFVPNITSANPILQRTPNFRNSVENADPSSYVWLSLSDGTGVYRAVQVRGSAGVNTPGNYQAVLDSNNQRYEVRFKDLEELTGLIKNPARQSSGRIK